MSFGENLRTLLEERDVTQKELAIQLNIAPSTLGNYVQNTREPDFATVKLIAKYFQVSIDYLLDYQFEKKVTVKEFELIRIFRSMTPEQQDIFVEQGKAIARMNQKEKAKLS